MVKAVQELPFVHGSLRHGEGVAIGARIQQVESSRQESLLWDPTQVRALNFGKRNSHH